MSAESGYRASERNCPACESSERRSAGWKNGFEMLSCRNCRTLYAAATSLQTNGHDYDSYYSENNLSVPEFIHRRLAEIVAGFASSRKTNRLLDIGFGAGSILQAAARDGWDVEGQEISQSAVEHARSLGFKVFCGELAQARYPSGYFDVITASEVLEHLAEPQPLLREIARILRPGGLFWATTPHGRGLSKRVLGLKWSVVCPPEHLHLFSLSGMKCMLTNAGFSRVRMVAEGLNPYEIIRTLQRNGGHAEAPDASKGPERVEASYQLNEKLSSSPVWRVLKNTCNRVLRLSRLGDSVKIVAEK